MKLKSLVLALALLAVPVAGFASGDGTQETGTTNARVHIIVFGVKADAQTSNSRHHLVLVGAKADAATCNSRVHIVLVGREATKKGCSQNTLAITGGKALRAGLAVALRLGLLGPRA